MPLASPHSLSRGVCEHVDPGNIRPGEPVLAVDGGTRARDVDYAGVTTMATFWHRAVRHHKPGLGAVGTNITNRLGLTSTTGAAQTSSITQIIGVSPAITPAALASGSVADNNGDGASLPTFDGSAFLTLRDAASNTGTGIRPGTDHRGQVRLDRSLFPRPGWATPLVSSWCPAGQRVTVWRLPGISRCGRCRYPRP